MKPFIPKKSRDFARALRANSTNQEKTMWCALRNRRMLNCKFRRQAPIGRFIVDFVCYEIRLIIEIDGGQHNWRAHYDEDRSRYLSDAGFKVLRFWNNEVTERLKDVLEKIYREISEVKNSVR